MPGAVEEYNLCGETTMDADAAASMTELSPEDWASYTTEQQELILEWMEYPGYTV